MSPDDDNRVGIPRDPPVSEMLRRVIETPRKLRKKLIKSLTQVKGRKKKKHKKKHPVLSVRQWDLESVLTVLKAVFEKHQRLPQSLVVQLHEERPDDYPSVKEIYTRFGFKKDQKNTWNTVKNIVGVPQVPRWSLVTAPAKEVAYYIHLYRQLGLRTRTAYIRAHKAFPEVVPSYGSLLRNVGGFTALKRLSKMDSCKHQVELLVRLMHKLGKRWPKKHLCREHHIDRGYLERRFGGREELETLCRQLLMMNEQNLDLETRNARQAGSGETSTRDQGGDAQALPQRTTQP